MATLEHSQVLHAILLLIALCILRPVRAQLQNSRPVADAGSSRYAATDPVLLDGTGSYDPDHSGTLSYTWRQISGPSVVIIDANTPTPTIAGSIQPDPGRDPTPKPQGFPQTDEIQECEFELVVSDGELTSLPDTVKVIIVPDFGTTKLIHLNPPFDPNKPTWISFGGLGGCQNVGSNPSWFVNWPAGWGGWGVLDEKVNYIWFEQFHHSSSTIRQIGDMFIVYLSTHAPDYKQPIQSDGTSAGGEPAIDIGIHLNETYADRRYAVNRVTLFDAAGYCRDYKESISRFLASAVDGEQCWIDSYPGTLPGSYGMKMDYGFQSNVLNVWFDAANGPGTTQYKHELPGNFYGNSFIDPSLQGFNHGVIAGSFWSVIGPGKNLQLASTPGVETYKFTWYGESSSGYMDFYDEPNHPGRLPEPVTLLAYSHALNPNDVPTGALLTCEESENAVGYQLLLGSDPYRVMDYNIVSDTPTPPAEIVTTFPFKETWWTVRAYDQYGSTIHVDPVRVNLENLPPLPPIDNLTNGKRYGYIQLAINDSKSGDEIVVGPGVYHENISFQGKNITLRSTEPTNSAIVAATMIEGDGSKSVVTFSGGEDANSTLAGLTIWGGNAENGGGIYCGANSTPMIAHCVITNNSATQSGGGIHTHNSSPTVRNCIIYRNSAKLGAGVYTEGGNTTLINCTLADNTGFWAGGICNFTGSPVLTNCILWDNADPEIGSMARVTYSDIRGGWPGEGNLDADPMFADLENGDYHLKSRAGRWDPIRQNSILDDVTSPCIDEGDPTSTFSLEPLPNGDRINMGAYGGTSEASKSP